MGLLRLLAMGHPLLAGYPRHMPLRLLPAARRAAPLVRGVELPEAGLPLRLGDAGACGEGRGAGVGGRYGCVRGADGG